MAIKVPDFDVRQYKRQGIMAGSTPVQQPTTLQLSFLSMDKENYEKPAPDAVTAYSPEVTV